MLIIVIIVQKFQTVHQNWVSIKRGYGCGTERIDGMDMRIERGADMGIKRGADMRIKRGADMWINSTWKSSVMRQKCMAL